MRYVQIHIKQPLSVFREQGSRLVIWQLEPRYNINMLKKNSQSNSTSKVCKHTVAVIKYVQAINFASDIWNPDVGPLSHLVLTKHFM